MFVFVACSEKEAPRKGPPPTDVSVVITKAQDVPLYVEFVGEIHGMKDIAIRARVEGFLEEIHFQEGSEIEKGTLLYTQESRSFEENVAAKMSKVAEEKTMLAKATGDLDRIRPLAEMNAVSQSDLDEAVATYKAAISSVEAAQANLRGAEIELGYTMIHAPISGIIGRTKAKSGDFVGLDPNPVILNTISQVDPILVTFFITETHYLQLARLRAGAVAEEVENDEPDLQLILVDGSVYEHKGKVDFIDREVDPTTGAMLVQSSFPNPEKILRPGQFAKVKIRRRVEKDGILIPQRCIVELQGTYSVFVVDDNNKVDTREIKVGSKVQSLQMVTEGLKLGEKVVYEGLQKVKDGMTVQPTITETESTERGKE